MLYAPTSIRPELLDQQIRVILPPDAEAPEGSVRTVQIVVPEGPTIYLGLDVRPKEIGPNRGTYSDRMAPVAPDQMIEFDLLPHQWIVATVEQGYAKLAVIVQHRMGG